MTTITLNGKPHQLGPDSAVDTVVASLGAPDVGTAVAVNGEVVPRSDWPGRRLADGDRVEVLRAVAGG